MPVEIILWNVQHMLANSAKKGTGKGLCEGHSQFKKLVRTDLKKILHLHKGLLVGPRT